MKRTFYQKYAKRALDIVLSSASLPVLLPAIGCIAAAIELDDPGPVFFIQKRVEKKSDGRTSYFPILKFRTMKQDTPHDVPTHLLKDPDQYITKVGKLLRKTSLDELPQIFNILGGDMSVIGPRPALWNQYDLIRERDRYHANEIMPGLTGWAQCNGRDELSIKDKAAYDGYYAEHLSFSMDCRCFLKSIIAVLEEKGQKEGASEKKTKKILFVTNHSYMFWQFRRELLKNLLEQKYEIYLATPYNGHEDDFAAMGCHVIRTDLNRRGVNPVSEEKLFHRYATILKTVKPDLMVSYSIKPNIYAGIAASLLGIPYCINVQGLGTAFEKPGMVEAAAILYRIACQKARCVFFENKKNAEYFMRQHIVSKDKIKVLSGAGVNLEYFSYQKLAEHRSGKVHFLYLGRIMKEKGIDELFEAVRRLSEEVGHSFVLDLVGFYEDEYKEEVEELERRGIAHFYGFQSDPRPYYGKADCVVLPSYHEGMSNVLLEAAATGRMLVTSAIPGCREAVEQGKNGFLCRPKSADSLYQVMKHVLTLSRPVMEEMGAYGRRKMEHEFDRRKIVRETVETLCDQIK